MVTVFECQIYGKIGHITLECYHRGNYSYQPSGPPASMVQSLTPTYLIQPQAHYSYQIPPHATYIIQSIIPVPEMQYQV